MVVNETVPNKGIDYFQQVFFPQTYDRVIDLLKAPVINPEMIWMVTPLVIVTLLMTFYFGRYKKEELGWNTVVGNSLILIFIAIDLLRKIFNMSFPGSAQNLINNPILSLLSFAVLLTGILLMLMNYSHFLPKRMAFFLSSPLTVNLIAYTVMAIVYAGVPASKITLVAAIALFIILFIILKILQVFQNVMGSRLSTVREEERNEEEAEEEAKEILKSAIEKSDKSTKRKLKKLEKKDRIIKLRKTPNYRKLKSRYKQ